MATSGKVLTWDGHKAATEMANEIVQTDTSGARPGRAPAEKVNRQPRN